MNRAWTVRWEGGAVFLVGLLALAIVAVVLGTVRGLFEVLAEFFDSDDGD